MPSLSVAKASALGFVYAGHPWGLSLGLLGPVPQTAQAQLHSSHAGASLPVHTGHSQNVPTLRPEAKVSASAAQNPTTNGKHRSNARMEATLPHLPAISATSGGHRVLIQLPCQLSKTSQEGWREENTGDLGHEPQATLKPAAVAPWVAGRVVSACYDGPPPSLCFS